MIEQSKLASKVVSDRSPPEAETFLGVLQHHEAKILSSPLKKTTHRHLRHDTARCIFCSQVKSGSIG